tara:strand:- start:3876 stop:4511 length:636 start_codon:yes stop_codon:yes gene_type:complete
MRRAKKATRTVRSVRSSRKSRKSTNSNRHLWNLDLMNNTDRLFIDKDNIKNIDNKESELYAEMARISSLETQKSQMTHDIRHYKGELTKTKQEYRKLLKEGKCTIRMDLDVGDVILMKHRLIKNTQGEPIASHFDKLGYVYGDIEIIRKTDKSITLKYDTILNEDVRDEYVIESIEKTLNITNFKQIYLQLYNDEDIQLMVRDNIITEVLK